MSIKEMSIDHIIEKLIKHTKTKFTLVENEVKYLIYKSKEIFLAQPVFLELESPINVCGDIHGQYVDLLRILFNVGFPPKVNYLFLGDYVDRGQHSLESICLLLALKIKFPNNIYLLRGNHESSLINRVYGFYDECKRRLNIKVWKSFIDVFNSMPITGSIDDKILCMHGGLSKHLTDLDMLRKIVRPTEIPDEGLLCDLLWSDPDRYGSKEWDMNDRGISVIFNSEVVKKFTEKHNLDLIVRAHQVVEEGYEFFASRRLVTIFSAPNYCGEFDNIGGVLHIDEDLKCNFNLIKPFKVGKNLISSKNRESTPPKFKTN